MLAVMVGRPDIKRPGIDKLVAFGPGNLTLEAGPGEQCQTCMQHAFLLRLGNLLRETVTVSTERIDNQVSGCNEYPKAEEERRKRETNGEGARAPERSS